MANEEEYEIDEEQQGLRHVGRGPLAEKGTRAPALVGELVSALNRMFPPADAEPWDRTGLLVGDPSAKIEGVACALDPTVPAVREAAQLGANVQLIDETQRAVKSLFSDPQRAHEAALLRQAAEARYGKGEEYAGRN